MKEMPLTDHLAELRKVCIRTLGILGLAFGVCYGLGDHISEFLLAPLRHALGESGAGCAEFFGLSQQDLPVLIGTFGKALGCSGAFVAG